MEKRFVSIWFRHLSTDWFTLRQPKFKGVPFVLSTSSHGRMIITATNHTAERAGLYKGMVLADARAIVPNLEVIDDPPDLIKKLLKRIAEWCIRFTPSVAIDPPDGLLLDVTGCSHLWGDDTSYLNFILKKLTDRGYDVCASMADTIGVAWGMARFGDKSSVISRQKHVDAMMNLPPEALRLEATVAERLHKLGLRQIKQFIGMPRPSLRRRFGMHFIMRLETAIGLEPETIEPIQPIEPYQERLPCLDPIVTAPGIAMALQQLLEKLCLRLQHDQKGLRTAVFKGYRVDGKMEKIEIGTNRPSYHTTHLFKLFETKISTIEPAWGIELFILEAPKVEDYFPKQEKMWEASGGLDDVRLSELIDRLACRVGIDSIHRYLPDEHYWPERSFKPAANLHQQLATVWRSDLIRPLHLLSVPQRVEGMAALPDYPPKQFVYHGKVHNITKADGPERIEQEWWLQQGQHRDYYRVEDDEGNRYWLFRLGHYSDENYQWFIHGFFV